MTKDEMIRQHHGHSGQESEQTPGDSEGQGSLACCSPWGHREADATERLSLHAWREEEGTEAEPRFGDCTPE